MFNEKVAEKDRLTKDINDCEIKLERAQKLTDGLSDEKTRWARDIEILNSKYDLLAGDSLVSAGMVAYSGPFTSSFRTDLQVIWIE